MPDFDSVTVLISEISKGGNRNQLSLVQYFAPHLVLDAGGGTGPSFCIETTETALRCPGQQTDLTRTGKHAAESMQREACSEKYET